MFDYLEEDDESIELKKLVRAFHLVSQTAVTHSRYEIELTEVIGDVETVVR